MILHFVNICVNVFPQSFLPTYVK